MARWPGTPMPLLLAPAQTLFNMSKGRQSNSSDTSVWLSRRSLPLPPIPACLRIVYGALPQWFVYVQKMKQIFLPSHTCSSCVPVFELCSISASLPADCLGSGWRWADSNVHSVPPGQCNTKVPTRCVVLLCVWCVHTCVRVCACVLNCKQPHFATNLLYLLNEILYVYFVRMFHVPCDVMSSKYVMSCHPCMSCHVIQVRMYMSFIHTVHCAESQRMF